MVKPDKSEYNSTFGARKRREESREVDGGRNSKNDEYVPCDRSGNIVVPSASGTDTATTQTSHTGATQSPNAYATNTVVHCSSVGVSGVASASCVAQKVGTRQRDVDTVTVTNVELSISVGKEEKSNASASPGDNDIHGATAKPTFSRSSSQPFNGESQNTAGCYGAGGCLPTDDENYLQISSSVSDLGVQLRTSDENGEDTVTSRPYAERRLSMHQHKTRLESAPVCDVGHDHCFRLKYRPRWPDEKEAMVKEYCAKRMGLIQDFAKRKYLGTCWRVEKEYVVTCHHCVNGYLCKDNDKTLIKGDLCVTFDTVGSLGVSYYEIHQEIPCVNAENDIAVLKLSGNCVFPPAFDNFDFSRDEPEEVPIYNIGYQYDNHGEPPVLVVDKAIVLKRPCKEEFIQLNNYIATTYNDEVGYTGLNRKGKIGLFSSIVGGGSGGVCVYPDEERNNCKVYGMYQNGYPYHYYTRSSFEEKVAMRPCLKIESAISMAEVFDVFPWKRT